MIDHVIDALAGEMAVPTIGACSGCAQRDAEIARLSAELERARHFLLEQSRLIDCANDLVGALEAENVNRATRRSAARKRTRAGVKAV